MKTTKLLIAALASLMLLTSACGKSGGSVETPVEGPAGSSGSGCTNCSGFVAGPTVFTGNLSGSAYSLQGLTVIADQNSLANIYTSSPRTTGSYQGMVVGGTFVASGSNSCIPNGTYSLQGSQVGMISPNLQTQAVSPLWVSLTGPATFKGPLYIKLNDTNGDDIGDVGTTAYLWFYCNGAWTSVGMSAQ